MNVVGYARLSRDEDKENYSSILSQEQIINEYAETKNWTVGRIYIDDNYSGYTLDRPAFSQMIEELENGKIDVVIAKDLSRIGRNNGKVLVLIDRFKELNKRLILVNESNGGLDILEDDSDILGIKTWYNEMYVKDISRKIRANMYTKQKRGELIMGNFYGYRKEKVNNKYILVVDEEIRPIIELIFDLYINEGMGYKRICDVLDERGCITPSQYIKERHEEKNSVFKNKVSHIWQTHMVKRILENDLYIGTLRTRKRQAKFIKGKQEIVPKDEQYVFTNNHQAIINEADFELAQEINIKKNERNARGKAKYNYVFSTFLVCGDCGNAVIGLNLRKKPDVVRGYNCTMYQKYGKKHCFNHAVKEDKVLFFFKEYLKDIKEEYLKYIANIDLLKKKNDIDDKIKILEKDLGKLNEELKLLLNQKVKDLIKESNNEYREIIEHSYEELENDKKKKINSLNLKLSELIKLKNSDLKKELKDAVSIFDKIIEADVPKRKDLELILDKVIINKSRNLEYVLKVKIDRLTN